MALPCRIAKLPGSMWMSTPLWRLVANLPGCAEHRYISWRPAARWIRVTSCVCLKKTTPKSQIPKVHHHYHRSPHEHNHSAVVVIFRYTDMASLEAHRIQEIYSASSIRRCIGITVMIHRGNPKNPKQSYDQNRRWIRHALAAIRRSMPEK